MKSLLTALLVLLLAFHATASSLRGSENTKHNNQETGNDERNLQGLFSRFSDAPSDIPLFIDGAIYVSPSPTKSSTASPTLRPTSFPTWTFKVPDSQRIEEAKAPDVCEFCPRGCYFGNRLVDFGRGAQATCDKIMDIAPRLTPFQCNVDRERIESTCCCQSGPNAESRVDPDIVIPLPEEEETPEADEIGACDFCVNEIFLNDPVIEFNRGDSVSCRGFKDLLEMGTMPEAFCRMERAAIEDACCQRTADSEPVEVVTRTSPESRVKDVGINLAPPPAAVTPRAEEKEEEDDEDDDGSCSICEGKRFIIGPTINFSTGDSVSCAGLKSLVGMGLPPTFCKNERAAIEAACCPSEEVIEPVVFEPLPVTVVEQTFVEESNPDETFIEENAFDEISVEDSANADIINSVPASPIVNEDPCSFCVGQTFMKQPIINFRSGNDSVSCGGLKELLQRGLPPMFCRAERVAIEETCCRPLTTAESITSPVVEPNSVPGTQLLASPTAEPTGEPTMKPTSEPTASPSTVPTAEPTNEQTTAPTTEPTVNPTAKPTTEPTAKPTLGEIIESETQPVSDSISVSLTGSSSTDNVVGETEASTETIRGRGEIVQDEVESKEVAREHNRQGFFEDPTSSIQGQNNAIRDIAGPLISTKHNRRQGFFETMIDQGQDEIHLDQNSYPLSSSKSQEGFFADEINLEKSRVEPQPDDENTGSTGKRTGLFKDAHQDSLTWSTIDTRSTIYDTDQRDYLVFAGGLYRGRQVTTSF